MRCGVVALPRYLAGVGESFRKAESKLLTFSGLILVSLAAIFTGDVIGRYAIGVTASWVVDLEWYLFALALACAMGPTLTEGRHVRVDVFHDRYTASTKLWLDRIGHLLFLLPWCAFVVYAAGRYTYNSWLVGEGSPDPGGLPYRWLIKGLLPLGFALLAGAGVLQLFTSQRNRA